MFTEEIVPFWIQLFKSFFVTCAIFYVSMSIFKPGFFRYFLSLERFNRSKNVLANIFKFFAGWAIIIGLGLILYSLSGLVFGTSSDVNGTLSYFGWFEEVRFYIRISFTILGGVSILLKIEELSKSFVDSKVDCQAGDILLKSILDENMPMEFRIKYMDRLEKYFLYNGEYYEIDRQESIIFHHRLLLSIPS